MTNPLLARTLETLRAKRKEQLKKMAEDDLYEFFRQAWPYFDSVEFMGNWHLEVLCEQLMAVNRGELRRLIVNVPPRTAKTALVGVAWPLWTWIQNDKRDTNGPGAQFLFASYSYDLSVKSAEKSRRLMFSKWFQENWGDRFSILADANRKDDFVNDHQGSRLSTSVNGVLTGMGGSIVVCDDPNSASDAESKAIRENTNLWWDEALSTRLNNPKTGAFVVVQQRLHEDDITGHILTNSAEDWSHVMLPMRYDSTRASPLDIRTVDGELLWPERFGEKEVTELERRLGPTAASGQLQQSPTPRGGSIIQTDDWQRWPGKNVPELDYVVASLDTGMTDKEDSDYSALTVWGCFQAAGRVVGGELEGYDFMSSNEPSDRPNLFGIESRERMDVVSASLPKVLLLYAWAEKLPLPQLVEKVISSCFRFKVDTLVIENKAHGHAVNQVIKEMLAQKPFSVVMFDPRRYGDKSARLYAVQHLFSEEMIYAPGDWVDDYWSWKSWTDPVIQQFAQFPRGAHDDYVDSGSQALHHLRARGFAPRKEQVVTGAVRGAMHKSRSKPLYNA